MTALGMTTRDALCRLCDIIEGECNVECERLGMKHRSTCQAFSDTILSTTHAEKKCAPWTYCWVYLAVLFACVVGLIIGSFSDNSVSTVQLACGLIFGLLTLTNLWLSTWLSVWKRNEVLRKAQKLLCSVRSEVDSSELLEYMSVYEPDSECIHLQWTMRDGKPVNVPWILLVPGDTILIRPGHRASCFCVEIMPSAAKRKLGNEQVKEAPIIAHLRASFRDGGRPASFLDAEIRRTIHGLIERFIMPTTALGALLVVLLRTFQWPNTAGNMLDLYLTAPALIVLPMVNPGFPIYFWLQSVWNMATALCVVDGSGNVPVESLKDDDRFKYRRKKTMAGNVFSNVENSDISGGSVGPVGGGAGDDGTVKNKYNRSNSSQMPPLPSVIRRIGHLLAGEPDHLPLSANLVLTLGNLTSVSVVDKKGILSWPNPTPEKLFFFKEADKSSAQPNVAPSALSTEVLDLTHDPNRPFAVNFDDPYWHRYISNLKAIGRNVMLNSCLFDPPYNRFLDHVSAVSQSVPRTIAIATRRCCCFLADIIGFSAAVRSSTHAESCTLGAYRRQMGDPPVAGLIKHYTPIPNLFATVSPENGDDHCRHIMTQGTADLVLDACSYVWSGNSLHELSRSARRRIADFYQRNSMTCYCLAFSYRATDSKLTNQLSQGYIEWPLRSNANVDLGANTANQVRVPLALSADSLYGSADESSTLNDSGEDENELATAEDCLKTVLTEQTFLGMVTLQYQAKPEVINLIEQLERACIRFIYFSKENELRSRVFAEKIGLEAGWNCHISLGGEDSSSKKSSNACSRGAMTIVQASSKLLSCSGGSPKNHKNNSTTKSRWRRSASIGCAINLPYYIKNEDVNIASANNVVKFNLSAEMKSDIGISQDSLLGDQSSFGGEQHTSAVSSPSSRKSAVKTTGKSVSAGILESTSCASLSSSDREYVPLLPGPFPNTARLPQGIENVRPHLENVDNVPLLVSLFTDCDHSTNKEMLKIMQNYGEVVLVVGSSLNYFNGDTFSQANVACAVEPSHPSSCVRHTFTPSSTTSRSAGVIAGQLMSLPCSFWALGGQELNLLKVIALCRHLVAQTRCALIFLLMASSMLSIVQLLCLLFFMPPIYTPLHLLLWLCVSLPLLSFSFLGANFDQDQNLKLTTPKNENHVGKKVTRRAILGYCVKFLPSAVFLVLIYGACLAFTCKRTANVSTKCFLYSMLLNSTDPLLKNLSLARRPNADWSGWTTEMRLEHAMCQNTIAICTTLLLVVISMSFVHYRESVWVKNPLICNLRWVATCLVVIAFQLIMSALSIDDASALLDFVLYNWWIWIAVLVWMVVVVSLNELCKVYETKLYLRDQRRRKLCFGTKLGMNSPY